MWVDIPYMEHLGIYIYKYYAFIVLYLFFTYIVKGKSRLNNQEFIQMEHPHMYAPKPIPFPKELRPCSGVTGQVMVLRDVVCDFCAYLHIFMCIIYQQHIPICLRIGLPHFQI